ncbi:MAG: ArsR/SmtB family transcription factor [Promethearchaeota archaeon]
MPDEKLARAIRARLRRDILRILCKEGKKTIHRIVEELNITESTASRHLKLLYDLGLVIYENKPTEKFYSLRIQEIKEFLDVYDKIVKKLDF